MEIGGEFALDGTSTIGRCKDVPSWLAQRGNITLTTSGRGAISLLLDQVKPSVKKALLPSYICDSVIQPFLAAGYELAFYDVDEKLKPIDVNAIGNFNGSIYLHIGYFGFPTNDNMIETISRLRAKSVIVVEDVTHALFSECVMTNENDYVVGSIRKWFGTPSGGFLASPGENRYDLSKANNEFVSLRKASMHQKYQYLTLGEIVEKTTYLSGLCKAEQMLDEDNKPYRIDSASEAIIGGVDHKKLQHARRINYDYLLKNLIDVDWLDILFRELDNNVTPMFFPVYVRKNRDELRKFLIDKDIYCPVHWPIPDQVEKQLSSRSREIYQNILSIPCDQRYDLEDMNRVAIEIRKYKV